MEPAEDLGPTADDEGEDGAPSEDGQAKKLIQTC